MQIKYKAGKHTIRLISAQWIEFGSILFFSLGSASQWKPIYLWLCKFGEQHAKTSSDKPYGNTFINYHIYTVLDPRESRWIIFNYATIFFALCALFYVFVVVATKQRNMTKWPIFASCSFKNRILQELFSLHRRSGKITDIRAHKFYVSFFSSLMLNLLQYVAKWLRIMMNGTDVLFWNRKRNHHFQCFLKYRYWFMPRQRFSFSGVRLLSSGNLCFVLPKTRHNVTVLYVPKHTVAFTSTRYLWLNVLLTLGPGPSFEQYVRSLCYFTFFSRFYFLIFYSTESPWVLLFINYFDTCPAHRSNMGGTGPYRSRPFALK